ncbi:hypothetical protein ACQKCH_15095 [Nubsella zeaxanthinifaciens]|jgi:hypothetical protein|uniref:hypothetical protein n=1 Tax=Nubsella zeaxanthinifaciens TaxID=392412 RepID=UPI003CFC3E31
MKNLKNLAFGLLVAVLAVGFSAFTNAEKSTTKVDTFLVQDELGNWIVRTVEPEAIDCASEDAKQCYYKVLDDSILGPTDFTEMQIDNFLQANPAQIENGQHSQPGLYTGN